MSQEKQPTPQTTIQRQNLHILKRDFDLSEADLERCLFFSSQQDEPWIPPDLLQAIALQVGSFKYVGVKFEQFVAQLAQHIWTATVIDEQERTFERSGVATIGETPNGEEIDTHVLAGGRALSAALNAAGFNPFRAGTIAITRRDGTPPPPPLSDGARTIFNAAQSAELRGKDLRQIHKLAENCGLITGKDQRLYRQWLSENYHVTSAATLDATMRASVINALTNYDLDNYLLDVPQELRADAAIA